MSGFLDEMGRSSAARAALARSREPLSALERRARAAAPVVPLRLSGSFDVIAELKLRSPAAGVLRDGSEDWLGRVATYARAGAAAVSVLTEPLRFDGSLAHLEQASAVLAPLGVPAMRKDFLVDPYQVVEARAAGAGGVLVILRMLSRAQTIELLDAAAAHGMFVLLEAFDADDLELARSVTGANHESTVLFGVNCRDLQSLQVVPSRFADLAVLLPHDRSSVAESGVANAVDAKRMRELGYSLALIGTALMTCDDPAALLQDILTAARATEN